MVWCRKFLINPTNLQFGKNTKGKPVIFSCHLWHYFRLAIGWMVQGSNSGGGGIFLPNQTGPGVHTAFYKMVNIKVKSTLVQAAKARRGSRRTYSPTLSPRRRPNRFTPGKDARCLFYRRLGRHRGGLDGCGKYLFHLVSIPVPSSTCRIPGFNRPGRELNHPPSSSIECRDKLDLYLYSPSAPSWQFIV
jgi:hypothetical protein